MILNVKEKSGWVCGDSGILVTDFRGEFYKRKTQTRFNLPKGVYEVEGDIAKLKNPVTVKYAKTPKRERKIKQVPINIVIQPNPNKASINTKTGKLIFDRDLYYSLNTPELRFIFFHELGHFYYKTETKCDTFSANLMLKTGFNYSQIMKAVKVFNSKARKLHTVSHIIEKGRKKKRTRPEVDWDKYEKRFLNS